MPTYLSPGVYMEEVSSGPKPIEAVGTATAAFVGFTEAGPVHTPTLITNWPQYQRTFGGFIEGAYMPAAIFSYFMNGGGNAYVVRIGAEEVAASTNGAGPVEPPVLYATASLPAAEGKRGTRCPVAAAR